MGPVCSPSPNATASMIALRSMAYDRLPDLEVVEWLPLRVHEEEVVAEAWLRIEGDAALAAHGARDLRVDDDAHVGGLRAERRGDRGLVRHDVDPNAVEVRLTGDVVVLVRLEAHE